MLTLGCLWGTRACTETVPCLGGAGRADLQMEHKE